MKAILKIKDEINKDILSVSLVQLLNCLKGLIASYGWTIYELDAIGQENINYELGTFCDTINSSEFGYDISWDDLTKKSAQMSQIIDLILVGNHEKTEPLKYTDDADWKLMQSIVIEIVDGSYWEIYTSNNEIIDTCKKKIQKH
jgi:hypothetical protein